MRFWAGKLIEVFGIGLVGFGLVQGFFERDMYTELGMLIAGGTVFYIGYIIEGGGRGNSAG
ncbi:MAG: hypothetical protein KIT79_09430 [Deltaproteobacteria bacterium]|nr:hypothetical protein [Deltaproteobacteria bacterium]